MWSLSIIEVSFLLFEDWLHGLLLQDKDTRNTVNFKNSRLSEMSQRIISVSLPSMYVYELSFSNKSNVYAQNNIRSLLF